MATTDLTYLKARRSAILLELSNMSATEAGGLPNHSGKANVDHVGYRLSLYRELEHISKLIDQICGGWEVVTEADT